MVRALITSAGHFFALRAYKSFIPWMYRAHLSYIHIKNDIIIRVADIDYCRNVQMRCKANFTRLQQIELRKIAQLSRKIETIWKNYKHLF